jgi:D-sedoheptulose 7-phosphate isomerase
MNDPVLTSAGDLIRAVLRQSIEVKTLLLEQADPTPARIATIMVAALRRGGKILFFGNGGSAADAQHIAAELVNRFLRDRQALSAIALTTDTSILTSVANDVGCERIFARQVEALARPGDVAVGLSTSGNSENVLQGLLAAAGRGATTVALTGRSGGKLRAVADLSFCVPSDHTPRIQEAHLTVLHAICEVVENELAGVW